jgi:hypothetical protein
LQIAIFSDDAQTASQTVVVKSRGGPRAQGSTLAAGGPACRRDHARQPGVD